MSEQTTTPKLFINIPELKARLSVDSISIVKSPITGKLFADAGGKKFKVQADIDFDLPIKFMWEEIKGFEDGCIVNVSSENTIRTL